MGYLSYNLLNDIIVEFFDTPLKHAMAPHTNNE